MHSSVIVRAGRHPAHRRAIEKSHFWLFLAIFDCVSGTGLPPTILISQSQISILHSLCSALLLANVVWC